MKASQYLYTSWKNAPNKGFSIYSVSSDVSKEDCDIIGIVTKYAAPQGLPYEPTEDEIKNLFPVNTTYFRLPSGKFCLAQSTYIGHEYKGFENPGRMGNYLVHAYIFNENPDLRPATFIRSELFRSDLSLEEWRATNPPPLPVVDIPDSCKVNLAKVSAFISAEGRKEKLKKIVQAILNCKINGKHIYFNDKNENMGMWLNAIELCLPSDIALGNYFNTFCLKEVNTEVKLPTESKLLFTVLAQNGFTTVRQRMGQGEYGFDLLSGAESDLDYSAYVNYIVELFTQDAFAAVSCVEQIGKICATLGVDADDAYLAYRLISGDSSFDSVATLLKAYKMAVGYPTFNKKAFANTMAADIISGKISQPNEAKDIVATIYADLDDTVKVNLITYYIRLYRQSFGDGISGNFAEEFGRFIPFNVTDVVMCGFADGTGLSYLSKYSADSFMIYLFAYYALATKSSVDGKYGENTVCKFVLQAIKNIGVRDFKAAEKLCSIGISYDGSHMLEYTQTVLSVICVAPYLNIECFFGYMSKLVSYPEKAKEYLAWYIKKVPREESIPQYYKKVVSDATYAKVDELLRAEQIFASFFEKLDEYVYSLKPMDKSMLEKYYKDFYSIGRDKNNLFIKNLEDYLNRSSNLVCDMALLYRSLNSVRTLDAKALDVFRRHIANLKVKEYEKCLASSDSIALQNLVQGIEQSGTIIPAYRVAFFSRCLPVGKYKKMDNEQIRMLGVVASKVKNGEFYLDFERCGMPQQLFVTFVDECMDKVINLAMNLIIKEIADKNREKNWSVQQFVDKVFEEVFGKLVSVSNFKSAIYNALMGMEDVEQFIAFMIMFVVSGESTTASAFNELLDQYLDGVKSGQRKALYRQAQGYCDKECVKKIENYGQAFELNHKQGIFSKLFGGKK